MTIEQNFHLHLIILNKLLNIKIDQQLINENRSFSSKLGYCLIKQINL